MAKYIKKKEICIFWKMKKTAVPGLAAARWPFMLHTRILTDHMYEGLNLKPGELETQYDSSGSILKPIRSINWCCQVTEQEQDTSHTS